MKKIFSKILILLLLFLILFNFVYKNEVQAAPDEIIASAINVVTNVGGGVYGIITWWGRLQIVAIAYAIDKAFYNMAMSDNGRIGDDVGNITPFQIFFNKYKLLDINIFNINSYSSGSIGYSIRSNVAVWFYTVRLISSIILLAILVYVGIRMALSTISSDKARYKEMLVDWCVSLILIFTIQYIAIFIFNINGAIVKSLEGLATSTVTTDGAAGMFPLSDINDIHGRIALLSIIGIGFTGITATFAYCGLTFMTIGFFIAYVKRLIKVAFLIIISPLISITYSIDKMKDKKAQAFNLWFKEFAYTVLIQPFHCLIYLTFVNVSYSILMAPFPDGFSDPLSFLGAIKDQVLMTTDMNMITNSFFVILSLIFVKHAEEIVRKIFGFSDDNKSTSFGAGMAMSLMAVNQAKNIGTQTRRTFNKLKNTPLKYKKAFEKDFNKFRKTNIGKNISKKVSDANDKVSKTFNRFNESSQMKSAKKFANDIANSSQMRKASKAKQKITGAATKIGQKGKGALDKVSGSKLFSNKKLKPFLEYWKKKNSLASVIGSMYGVSQLMNGDMPLEAYADSVAVQQGVDAFFNSGERKLAQRSVYSARELDKIEYEKAVKDYNSNIDPNNPNLDPLENALRSVGFDSIEMYREQVAINKEANNGASYKDQANQKRIEAKELRKNGNEKLLNNGIAVNSGVMNDELRNAKKLEKEAKKLDKLAEEEARIEALAAQKELIDNFYTRDAIVERTKERSAPPTKKEFKDASKALKEFITDLIIERNKINNDGGGYTTLEDEKVAKVIQESFEEIIKTSIGAEEEVDYSKLLEERLDITRQDDAENYESAMQIINNLRQLHLQKRFSETFEPLYDVEGDEDRFGRQVAGAEKSKINAERRAKRREERRAERNASS